MNVERAEKPWLPMGALAAFLVWMVLGLIIDGHAGWEAIQYRTVSDLIQENPVLVPVSIFASAVAMIGLAMVFRHVCGPMHFAPQYFMFAAGGAALIAAVFPTDPGALTTVVGWVHGLATVPALVAPVGAMWSMVAWLRRGEASLQLQRALAAWAIVASVFLGHLGLLLAVRVAQVNEWTRSWGIAERLVIIANMSWVAWMLILRARRVF